MSFPSHHQFLIGRNYENPNVHVPFGKIGFRFKVFLISRRIEAHPEVLQIPTYFLTKPGMVFPDPPGKDQGVASIHFDQECADPMAYLLHQYIKSQPGAPVALQGRFSNIPKVIADTRDAQQTTFLRQLVFRLFNRDTEMPHRVRHPGRIEVSDPIIVGQTRLGAETKTASDRNPVADPGNGTAATEVAGDHPDWFSRRYDGQAELGGQIDLTQPEAAAWLEDTIDRLITEHELVFFRLDYNVRNLGAGGCRLESGFIANSYWRYYGYGWSNSGL